MTDPKHPDPHKPAAPKAASKPHPKPHAHPVPHVEVEKVIKVEREPPPPPKPGILAAVAAGAIGTALFLPRIVFRGARGFRGRGWGRRR